MSWWQSKLQGQQPEVQRTPPPMYSPPVPVAHQQPPAGHPQAPATQQQGVPAQQQLGPGQIDAGTAWQMWQGGEGNKKEIERCPSCNGGNFFSRTNTSGISRLGAPAPSCFDCGYPLTQFGSKTGAGGDMQTTNPQQVDGTVKAAREAPSFQGGPHLNQIVGKVQ